MSVLINLIEKKRIVIVIEDGMEFVIEEGVEVMIEDRMVVMSGGEMIVVIGDLMIVVIEDQIREMKKEENVAQIESEMEVVK